MQTHFNIESLVKKGYIKCELDYEKALLADRQLKLLVKENPHFKTLRYKLRDIIDRYESCKWCDVDKIDDNRLIESDKTEYIAEQERLFIENRKQTIEKKIKECDLTLENLSSILGHKSKTHMSELMDGIKSFTVRDLIIINRLFNIEMDVLLPRFLSKQDQEEVKEALKKLNNPNINLSFDDFSSNLI